MTTTPEKATAAVGYASRELAAAYDRVDALVEKVARTQAELIQMQISLDVARSEVARAESALGVAEQLADAMPPAPKADAIGGSAGSAHNPMVRVIPAETPEEPS